MRVFDRHEGVEVDLPKEIDPGRFRLLADAELTADVRLRAGQVVLGDTWRDFLMADGAAVIKPIGRPGVTAGRLDLLELAVSTLASAPEDERVSPLMPAAVGGLAELGELERTLLEHISHLREINQRPRMSMHYESEVAPLSRVRKLAPGAIAHLAAHSEDWHRRTLSGIQPKRILGLFSEDDLTIYENRVYARLLEKLGDYITRRLDHVAELVKQCDEALLLDNAEDLDYRLRTELYALWGDAFSGEETQRLLDASKGTMQTLESLGKQVNVLRNGTLYLGVPRNLRVPEQLRETNILQHDQHYRHLRTLWLLHQQRKFGKPLTAREAVDKNLKLFEDYTLYVGMLCRRVMAEFKLLDRQSGECWFAGRQVTFFRQDDEWCLDFGEVRLVIVPVLGHEAPRANAGARTQRRVLVSLLAPDGEEQREGMPDSTYIIVNPGDFYGLEKIRMVFEAFLWREAFSQYGKPIGRLPDKAAKWLQAKGLVQGENNQRLAMLRPLFPKDEFEFSELLKSENLNEQTRASIRHCAENLRALSSCRECGARASFSASTLGFQARCPSCSASWRLWTEQGKRIAELSVESSAARIFLSQGARYLRLPLS